MNGLGITPARRLIARVRMPLFFASLAGVLVGATLGGSGPFVLATMALFTASLALYFRIGTPHGRSVDVRAPVDGAWVAFNSPSTRVPSHRVHSWGQTYALDLVYQPDGRARPAFGWWPLFTAPEQFPAFGEPVRSPIDGSVVRTVSFMRDHQARSSLPGLLDFILESVRELFGPIGILGNHVVVQRADGVCALVAHLRRHSVTVDVGDEVAAGQIVGECGNSGNSTEPHVHLQLMDRPSPWIAAGLAFTLSGVAPPGNGERLPATIPRKSFDADTPDRPAGPGETMP